MNTFGHIFFRKVNNNQFDEIDAIEDCEESGYFFCKICKLEIYFYADSKNMYASVPAPINKPMEPNEILTCNEMIIKELLE